MPDHFAVLDQPRRPWLDTAALKNQFHRVAATVHPDAVGGDAGRFAALEEAYRVLRDPMTRLRHLLELEAPETVGSSATPIPPGFVDFFMDLAGFEQAAGAFRKKELAASGALARALLAPEKLALQEKVVVLQAKLETAREAAEVGLKELDAEWDAGVADRVERGQALQQRFAYLSKWRAQIAESVFHLAP